MSSYTPLATVYAADEDLALRATTDFDKLVPADQKVAGGLDGVLGPGGWTFTAASVADWGAIGVKPGMVVQLEIPRAGLTPIQLGSKELLVVDTVATGTLTLRRKGMASGMGLPPGPPLVGATQCRYSIATLAPQIEDVSYELNRRFGVDPLNPIRTPAAFYDIREVNQVCVLTVLARQYMDMARAAGKDAADTLWAKYKATAAARDDVLARLTVHWQNLTGYGLTPSEPSTTRFSTRISR